MFTNTQSFKKIAVMFILFTDIFIITNKHKFFLNYSS